MKLFIAVFLLSIQCSFAQSTYFPPINNSAWDTVSISELNWCATELDELINYVGNNDSKAFIVLKDGKIVIEKYYGTFKRDSLWYWASAGKSLTAALVGIAQEKNFLNIQEESSNYLGKGWTSCDSTSEQKIKIVHQLSMSTGLNDAGLDKDCTLPTCLNCIANPGNRWAYHNAPYTLLDGIIENSSGLTLNQFVNTYVKPKTGMTGLFIKQGYNNVYVSTARSMARYGLLSLNNFIWENDTILADATFKYNMLHSSQNINQAYGYLWWLNGTSTYMLPSTQFIFNGSIVPDAPADMFSALGKNGQIINVVPSLNLVMVRMGNPPLNGDELPMIFNNEIWKRMNNLMCVQSSVATKKSQIKLYPNPTSKNLKIELNDDVILSIQIIDALGKIRFESNKHLQEIELENLNPGIYQVIVKSNNKIYSEKLSIQY